MALLSGSDVARYCSSFARINPDGVDLTPKSVSRIPRDSVIFLHGAQRGYAVEGRPGEVREAKVLLPPDSEGFYNYEAGELYELRFPRVDIPLDCTGFAFPRSSVNRLGIIKLETAVFDSGYSGEPTQTIFTPLRAKVHRDEPIVQLVLIRNERATDAPYKGFYQNEKG